MILPLMKSPKRPIPRPLIAPSLLIRLRRLVPRRLPALRTVPFLWTPSSHFTPSLLRLSPSSVIWSPLTRSDAINYPGAVFDLTLRDGYDTTMRKFAPRNVSPHIETTWLRTEVDALGEIGICEPCRDRPAVAHPIVVATKPKLRMCVDYSVWLNQWTVVLKHPIAPVNQLHS